MCGIAGRFNPNALASDPLWHRKASELLEHRGPDSEGYFCDAFCELVHRRLALLDLSPSGYQPMANEDFSAYIIFNGEIYNYQRLRTQLKNRGHLFRSTSDTEVLIHLFEEVGVDIVNQIYGMFAFAVYDKSHRRLFLARDRFGIKPLYYMNCDSEWIFSSEIKAILAQTNSKPTLDRQACYDFLGMAYVPEPLTGFNEIKVLPKGSYIVIDPAGHHIVQYYEPQVSPVYHKSLIDVAAHTSARLIEVLTEQSIADVNVAALLSGGIDSSLVVAGYSQICDSKPITFNIRFPDEAFDETPWARAVADKYQTQHNTVDIDMKEFNPDLLVKLLMHFDQPFADTSLIPTYWVSKAIRDRGIICALSGDGGDEAFGGYASFWQIRRLERLMRLPQAAQNLLIQVGDYLTPYTHDFGRQLAKAAWIAQQGQSNSAILLAGLSCYLNENQKEELVKEDARDGLAPIYRHFGNYSPLDTLNLEVLSTRLTKTLFSNGLPNDMLRKVDMMSMLAGIEIRVPFLDYQLVEDALNLPHYFKTDGQFGKLVLREIAEKWLPKKVVNHRKQGFSIPLDVMLNDSFYTLFADHLLSSSSYIRYLYDSNLVAHWLQQLRSYYPSRKSGTISRTGLYQRIIMLLSLELFMRNNNIEW